MTATNRQRGSSAGADTPPKVGLNLDTAERDGGARDPFVVIVNGQPLEMADPLECDWQLLQTAQRNEDDYQFLSLVLSEEDYDTFTAASYPAWKMRLLMDKYNRHFGLDVPRGESRASRRR